MTEIGESKRVCPRCGKVTDEFIGPLCKDCYVKEYGVARIPSKLTFIYCTECGSYKYQGRWNPGLGRLIDTLREFVFISLTKKIKPTQYIEEAWIDDVKIEDNDIKSSVGYVDVLVKISGKSGRIRVSEYRKVKVFLSPTLCPKCLAKRSKTSFEAVIQIRGLEGTLKESTKESIKEFIKNEIETKLKDSIVDISDVKEGFDIKVFDQVSARIIASKLKKNFVAKVTESFKVIGRRSNGKRRSRISISVRIFDMEPGDIILVNNEEPLLFKRKTRGGLEFINMKNGRFVILSPDEIWRIGFKKFRGEEKYNIKEKRLLLLSRNTFKTMFLDADKNYQDYLEYLTSKVYSLVETLREGNEYSAYVFNDKLFITKQVGSS